MQIVEIILILISFILVLFIHEIGHSIPILLRKGRITFFALGPLLFDDNKLQFNKNLNFYGGAILVSPPTNTNVTNREYIRYIYFGPLLSLLFSIVTFLIYQLSTLDIFLYLSIMSLGVLIGSIITIKTKVGINSYTDGRRLINAFKNNKAHQFEYHIYNLTYNFDKKKCYQFLEDRDITDDYKFSILYIMLSNKKEFNEEEIVNLNNQLFCCYNKLNKKMKKYFKEQDLIKQLTNKES